jgi:hypothetical protein
MKYELTGRDVERFNSKVSESTQCWTWSGSHFSATGYALFNMKASDGVWRPTVAHRVSYQIHKGPIPEGLVIDHLCRNRWCVNPDHLEAVTKYENDMRGESPMAKQRRQTQCIHGHAFTPDNTYVKPRTNKRECRQCMRDRDKRRGWRRGNP